MPRLPTSLLRRARSINPLLPLLLRPCRTLESARSELRWLKEAASTRGRQWPAARETLNTRWLRTRQERVRHTRPSKPERKTRNERGEQRGLRRLCHQRSRGVPLQYLLGTEFFGDLELRVKRGVLIPRQETAAAVVHLAERIVQRLPALTQGGDAVSSDAGKRVRILDLCTGTGCMGLLLAYELAKRVKDTCARVLGVDVSGKAVRLARENARRVRAEHPCMEKHEIEFVQGDVLAWDAKDKAGTVPSIGQVLRERSEEEWDIVLANPPYVSKEEYYSAQTEKSVRCFEPRLALVPEGSIAGNNASGRIEDTFYSAILNIADKVSAQVVMMEIGSFNQAQRVASLAAAPQRAVEVWRDDPSARGQDEQLVPTKAANRTVGSGNARTVVYFQSFRLSH